MKLLKLTFIFALLFSFFSANAQTEAVDTTEQEVFVFVENPPEFIGGDDARIAFLSKNIKYPQDAKAGKIQGTVYVTFIIEKDGRVSNVRVLRGIGAGCDDAALNAVKKMPNWKPGTQRGQKVRCQFNMPIKFTLSDDATEEKELTKKEKRVLKRKLRKEAKANKK